MRPMDAETSLVRQAALLKAANPNQKVGVYRNIVKALPWFSLPWAACHCVLPLLSLCVRAKPAIATGDAAALCPTPAAMICGYLLRSLLPFLTCIYETLLDLEIYA